MMTVISNQFQNPHRVIGKYLIANFGGNPHVRNRAERLGTVDLTVTGTKSRIGAKENPAQGELWAGETLAGRRTSTSGFFARDYKNNTDTRLNDRQRTECRGRNTAF